MTAPLPYLVISNQLNSRKDQRKEPLSGKPNSFRPRSRKNKTQKELATTNPVKMAAPLSHLVISNQLNSRKDQRKEPLSGKPNSFRPRSRKNKTRRTTGNKDSRIQNAPAASSKQRKGALMTNGDFAMLALRLSSVGFAGDVTSSSPYCKTLSQSMKCSSI
jgi:hypothetical protein